MSTRLITLIGLALSGLLPGFSAAGTPRMLFERSQIAELRERTRLPDLVPIWKRILDDAEAYCDRASPRYADPADPFPLPEKGEHGSQRRHDAALVHHVGRVLTNRMESIGIAYQFTERPELGQHGAALLLATVERFPATNPIVSKGFAGGRGDIMRGLAIGYDLLSDELDDDQRKFVAGACAEYLDLFVEEFNDPKKWWHGVHNYNGVNGGAAGCLALAISDVYPDRAREWVDQCVKIIGRWLATGFDEDGAYLEGVAYSGYGLSNMVLFADALLRSGQGDLFHHPAFEKLAEFYALSLLPGEKVYDARNDSSYAGVNVSVLGLARARNSGLYRWLWDTSGSDRSFLRILWDNQVTAVDPLAAGVPTARLFRGRGLCVWRTGWTENDVMFSIEAGPYYPVTHNQADKGHFTLYGLGHRWATDPGYANEHEPEGRGQTLGHSCVLVDGKGQARSGAGWGTNGTIATYENNERYGFATADCTEAYNRNNNGLPGAVVEHARRHAFFVYPHRGAPAYAVVADDIRKDEQAHDFTWQMMVPKAMDVELGDGRAVFQPIQMSGDACVGTPGADDGAAKKGGGCTLDLQVDEAGEYLLWARVRTLAEQKGRGDSFFVQMNDGRRVAWHMPTRASWTWAKISSEAGHSPVSYKLDAGKHRLAILPREPGAQVDCVLLTRDPDATPALPDARESSLFAEAETGQIVGPMQLFRGEKTTPRLVLEIDASSQVTLATDVFRPRDHHGPAEFPRFRASVRSVNPRYLAILLPLPAQADPPEVRFMSVEGKRRAVVQWPKHTDTFEWPEGDMPPRLLGFSKPKGEPK